MHEKRYCGGIQTLANKCVNNLIKQKAIFNHKNKICGKAKNYLLKIIEGAKAPQPPCSAVPEHIRRLILTMRDSQQRQRSDFTGCDFFYQTFFFDITFQFENVLSETPPPKTSKRRCWGKNRYVCGCGPLRRD